MGYPCCCIPFMPIRTSAIVTNQMCSFPVFTHHVATSNTAPNAHPYHTNKARMCVRTYVHTRTHTYTLTQTHTHTNTHTHVQISVNLRRTGLSKSLKQNKIWIMEFSGNMAAYQLRNRWLQTLVRSFSCCMGTLRIWNATRYSKMTHLRETMTPRCFAQKGLLYFKANALSDKCIMLVADLSESTKLAQSKNPLCPLPR